jgi:hypothetical protein
MVRDVHVVPDAGRWAVAFAGAARPFSHHGSRDDAIRTARRWAACYGGGLLLHGGDPSANARKVRDRRGHATG